MLLWHLSIAHCYSRRPKLPVASGRVLLAWYKATCSLPIYCNNTMASKQMSIPISLLLNPLIKPDQPVRTPVAFSIYKAKRSLVS